MHFAPTSPRVYAVIVHHRGLDMLDVCLRSLLDSAAVDLHIVIVKNGCHEPLPEIADVSRRIHVTEPPEPVGFSEANNVGAAWAARHLGPADAYYFVNNDTESKPATLDFLMHALDEHQAAVAGPLTLIHAAPDHINSVGIRITEDAGAWDDGIGISLSDYGALPGVREVAAVTGSALLIDARVFDELGGWNEVYEWYYEDIDLCLRAWKRGHKVIHVPQSVILHRISATMSEGSERKLFYFRRNRLLIGLLHWPADVLRTLLWRALFHEVVRAPWVHSKMQRKALRDILKNLPRYWRLRSEGRGDDSWRRFIEPLGSVPPISLPDLTTAEDSVPAALAPTKKAKPAAPRLTPPAPRFDELRDLNVRHKSRLLVLGWGPLPGEEANMHFAPGGRTWQLASSLADDGHLVTVASMPMPGSGQEAGEEGELIRLDDRLVLYRFERARFEEPGILETLIEVFAPDAIVAAAPVPCERAVQLQTDLPVWADLFGDPISEGQAKSMVAGGDHLSAYMRLVNRVLQRADQFSAVSGRQKWALIGQLGMAGRLNAAVGGTAIAHSVPCAVLAKDVQDAESSPSVDADGEGDDRIDDGPDLPADAVVALWSGSFNTWCDIDTLFGGLEIAMGREPRLQLVATGGAVAGHDETTHARLQGLLANSPHRERWHLLGSLPREDFQRLRARADFGLVTEKPIYERLLGSSGRILDWLSHGRPVVCTSLSEIGGMVSHGDFGEVYQPGDADDLARALGAMVAKSARERRTMGGRARDHVQEHLSIHATTAPLRQWAAEPSRSPDADLPRPEFLLVAGREAVRDELQDALDAATIARQEAQASFQRVHEIRSELGKIHQSSMWRLWTRYYDLRRFFKRLLPVGRS